MGLQWRACRGMTLMELLIALGLGASLSVAIMQLFVGSMHTQSVHSAIQDLQQRSAYVQFLLRSAIRESASPCGAENAGLMDEGRHHLDVLDVRDAPVSAVPESQVLRLRTADCEVPVHFYYIGRRGNDSDNPAGLFRRRQRSDGSYYRAEELVEGVTAMTASLGVPVLPANPVPTEGTDVAYVSFGQVSDWSRVFSVDLTLSVQHVSDMTMGHLVSGPVTDDGLMVRFSTALRQTELRRITRTP